MLTIRANGLQKFRAAFADLSIWWYAFGYFAAYIPYSALTKALSDGLLPGQTQKVSGFILLPVLGLASVFGNWFFTTALGWWKYAGRRRILGFEIPFPDKLTLLAGVCTAGIIPTTSLAYTFTGVSIVFIMLLMRGGVLIIAPLVDSVSGRKVHWYSWAALALALAALWVGFAGRGYAITIVALINAAIYVTVYFIRLKIMSRITKSDDFESRMKYFVEEQMVAPPVNMVVLVAFACLMPGAAGRDTTAGFTTFLTTGALVVGATFFAGFLSQITSVCGTLTLMDRRENTFCVPVNRASSVLSGIGASLLLWALTGARAPVRSEYWGAALIILAILTLSMGPRLGSIRRSILFSSVERKNP